MNRVKEVLKWFDLYGESISPLNIKGATKITTVFGGLVGMTVYGLLIWFFQTRLDKMVYKKDPIMQEVTQGLDLIGTDSPQFKFGEYSYSLGVGIYATKQVTTCSGDYQEEEEEEGEEKGEEVPVTCVTNEEKFSIKLD